MNQWLATAQWPMASDLDHVPSREEPAYAIKQMLSGKAPGSDGIPREVLKEARPSLLAALNALFSKIWNEEAVSQDFKDTLIAHIYKGKGERACCDNHHGISLRDSAELAPTTKLRQWHHPRRSVWISCMP